MIINEIYEMSIYEMVKYPKVYSHWKEQIDILQLPYSVHVTKGTGPSGLFLNWCSDNCESPWGWYWDDDDNGYIGFADNAEMVLFCLAVDYQRYL